MGYNGNDKGLPGTIHARAVVNVALATNVRVSAVAAEESLGIGEQIVVTKHITLNENTFIIVTDCLPSTGHASLLRSTCSTLALG